MKLEKETIKNYKKPLKSINQKNNKQNINKKVIAKKEKCNISKRNQKLRTNYKSNRKVKNKI